MLFIRMLYIDHGSYPISSSLTSKCCSSLLLKTTFRISHSQMFFKIGVLKNFTIFTAKHMCWNNFETSTQIFSYECIFFYRTPAVPVSGHLHFFQKQPLEVVLCKKVRPVNLLKRDSGTGVFL